MATLCGHSFFRCDKMFNSVCSENHRLHFPTGELAGGELVRPYECPERWDYIRSALTASNHTEFLEPVDVPHDLLVQIHSEDFLEFLQKAWEEWEIAGSVSYTHLTLPTICSV